MFVARKNEKTLGHKHCLCYVSISISNLTKSTQVRRNCAEKAGPTLSHIDQMKPVHRTAWDRAMERRLKGRREEVVRKGLKHPETQAHCTVSVHLEAQRQHKPKATAAAIFSQPLKVTLIKCISSELEFKITLEVWKPETNLDPPNIHKTSILLHLFCARSITTLSLQLFFLPCPTCISTFLFISLLNKQSCPFLGPDQLFANKYIETFFCSFRPYLVPPADQPGFGAGLTE